MADLWQTYGRLMADLGVIQQEELELFSYRFLPGWRGIPTPDQWETIDLLGVIDGFVNILGAPQADNEVFLYYRSNGALIERTQTDSGGNFTIGNLDRFDSAAYLLVVSSNDNASYNAITYDKLTAR